MATKKTTKKTTGGGSGLLSRPAANRKIGKGTDTSGAKVRMTQEFKTALKTSTKSGATSWLEKNADIITSQFGITLEDAAELLVSGGGKPLVGNAAMAKLTAMYNKAKQSAGILAQDAEKLAKAKAVAFEAQQKELRARHFKLRQEIRDRERAGKALWQKKGRTAGFQRTPIPTRAAAATTGVGDYHEPGGPPVTEEELALERLEQQQQSQVKSQLSAKQQGTPRRRGSVFHNMLSGMFRGNRSPLSSSRTKGRDPIAPLLAELNKIGKEGNTLEKGRQRADALSMREKAQELGSKMLHKLGDNPIARGAQGVGSGLMGIGRTAIAAYLLKKVWDWLAPSMNILKGVINSFRAVWALLNGNFGEAGRLAGTVKKQLGAGGIGGTLKLLGSIAALMTLFGGGGTVLKMGFGAAKLAGRVTGINALGRGAMTAGRTAFGALGRGVGGLFARSAVGGAASLATSGAGGAAALGAGGMAATMAAVVTSTLAILGAGAAGYALGSLISNWMEKQPWYNKFSDTLGNVGASTKEFFGFETDRQRNAKHQAAAVNDGVEFWAPRIKKYSAEAARAGVTNVDQLKGMSVEQQTDFARKFNAELQANPSYVAEVAKKNGTSPTSGPAPTAGSTGQGSASFTKKLVGAESGGSSTVKNKKSSAMGLGQFIDTTWLQFLNERHPEYANSAVRKGNGVQVLDSDRWNKARKDPALQREAIEWYADQNGAALTAAKIPVTDANLYLAHFLGPAGAIKAIRNPDAKATSAEISANMGVFKHTGTYRDAIAWTQRKMGGGGAETTATGAAVGSGITAGSSPVTLANFNTPTAFSSSLNDSGGPRAAPVSAWQQPGRPESWAEGKARGKTYATVAEQIDQMQTAPQAQQTVNMPPEVTQALTQKMGGGEAPSMNTENYFDDILLIHYNAGQLA